jgi:invasion protein IalB
MRFEGKGLAFALPALLVLLVAGLTVMLQALSASPPTDMAAQAAPSMQDPLAREAVAAPEPAPAETKPNLIAQEQTAPQPAAPTTTTTTTSQHGGWTVTCTAAGEPAQKTCSAQFRVVSKENNNALVLVWLLGRNAEGKLLAEFATPSDVQIKPGVGVSLDDASIGPAEFISCTSNQGCRAALELTPKLARDLKQAKKANVAITLLNGKLLQIGVDINGIEQALTELGA